MDVEGGGPFLRRTLCWLCFILAFLVPAEAGRLLSDGASSKCRGASVSAFSESVSFLKSAERFVRGVRRSPPASPRLRFFSTEENKTEFPVNSWTRPASTRKKTFAVKTLEFGRCKSAPRDAEQLLQNYWLDEQHLDASEEEIASECTDSSAAKAACILFCTTWDVRSKALSIALEKLAASQVQNAQEERENEDDRFLEVAKETPLISCFRVSLTNSLIIARGRRAIQKQTRMARNQKQLRHHELALRLMLQDKEPIHLEDLPALRLYYRALRRRPSNSEETEETDEESGLYDESLQRALEVRTATPSALKELALSTQEMQRLLFEERDPPKLKSASGDWRPFSLQLTSWIALLASLYQTQLDDLLNAAMQRARREYPIFQGFNLKKKTPINPF